MLSSRSLAVVIIIIILEFILNGQLNAISYCLRLNFLNKSRIKLTILYASSVKIGREISPKDTFVYV